MRYEHARVVHGYHGCDARVADQLLGGGPFKKSENNYDWLGHGIYFWEFGPDRAMRFAKYQPGLKKVTRPAVVGAIIQLGNCFDLLDTRFTRDLADAFPEFEETFTQTGRVLPRNAGATPELKLRRLDCAFLNWYFKLAEDDGTTYDTVRGCFLEGGPIFDSSGIHREAHVQIAVRNPDCILGVFKPS